MKKLAVLGSTGVVGGLALEIVRDYPNEFEVVSLACKNGGKKFDEQINNFKPQMSVVTTRDGDEAMTKAATLDDVDLVVVAVVGVAGIAPTLAAIEKGKNVVLATKEVLVVAGQIIMSSVNKHGVSLIPLDSEHSAIFQSLHTGEKKEIRRIILTMGKGRLSEMRNSEMEKVKLDDVLNRKNWVMGRKIAVDSATCINKSFEVVEAGWLFGLPPEKIEILVHPEYVCHSLVEFEDGSFITELGVSDMKRYVQYGLFYPKRKMVKKIEKLDLTQKPLSFESAPIEKFLGLSLGHIALKVAGTMPAVMHGADEIAVQAFGVGELGFTKIPELVKTVMDKHKVINNPTLNQLLTAEAEGREMARVEMGVIK